MLRLEAKSSEAVDWLRNMIGSSVNHIACLHQFMNQYRLTTSDVEVAKRGPIKT